VFALLAGCSSTVVGGDAAIVDAPGDARTDAPVDAGAPPGCDCPTGRCAVGERWTAPDGCNTCVCSAEGMGACTQLGCVPPDAGPVQRECGSNRDCAADEVCEYAQGCDTTRGRCVSNACQSLPVAPQYCGCEDATLQQTSACLPDRPWRSMGPCADAGS